MSARFLPWYILQKYLYVPFAEALVEIFQCMNATSIYIRYS